MDWMTILIIAIICLIVAAGLIWAANNIDAVGDALGM